MFDEGKLIEQLVDCRIELTQCKTISKKEDICVPADPPPEWVFISISGKNHYEWKGDSISYEQYRKLKCLPISPKTEGCVPDPDATIYYDDFDRKNIYKYKGHLILEEEYRRFRCLD